jgi:hypothetical protein
MHQTPASVNAFYASSMALHFWPIFDPSNPKTAEIRHFFPQAPSKLLNFSLKLPKCEKYRFSKSGMKSWLAPACQRATCQDLRS